MKNNKNRIYQSIQTDFRPRSERHKTQHLIKSTRFATSIFEARTGGKTGLVEIFITSMIV